MCKVLILMYKILIVSDTMLWRTVTFLYHSVFPESCQFSECLHMGIINATDTYDWIKDPMYMSCSLKSKTCQRKLHEIKKTPISFVFIYFFL